MSSPYFFLSHSSADKEFVRRLDGALKKADIETFFDERDIRIGQSIPKAVYDGLGKATHVLYVLSEKSIASKWVQEELEVAKMRQLSDGSAQAIPILIEDCVIPASMSHIKYADFRDWNHSEIFNAGFLNLLLSLGFKFPEEVAAVARWLLLNPELWNDLMLLPEIFGKMTGALEAQQSGSHDSSSSSYMTFKWIRTEDGLDEILVRLFNSIGKSNDPDLLAFASALNSCCEYCKTTSPRMRDLDEQRELWARMSSLNDYIPFIVSQALSKRSAEDLDIEM